MPFDSDYLDPLGTLGNQAQLRAALQTRTIYMLADDEDPEEFVAVDPVTAALPWAIGWHSTLFYLDPDDSTTAHDGVAVLVTNDGKRYKSNAVVLPVFSVLDKDEDTPPGSPSIGDRYLLPAASTGAWATHDDSIAIFTARGWEFILPRIGLFVLVEDEITFYSYTPAGAWVAGFGSTPVSADTVLPASVLGGRTHWVVVNQTTNTPPGSPATGVAYIIGGSPTGVWAGHAGKIAIYSGSAWIIITPAEGYNAYDQAQNNNYTYNGSAWAVAGGSIVGASTAFVEAAISTITNSTLYAGSPSVAPTTSQRRNIDTGTQISYTAKVAGKRLKFTYSCTLTLTELIDALSGGPNIGPYIGLFRDSEPNAIDWVGIPWMESGQVTAGAFTIRTGLSVVLEATAIDASAHTYRVAIFSAAFSSDDGFDPSMSRRRLSVDEYA